MIGIDSKLGLFRKIVYGFAKQKSEKDLYNTAENDSKMIDEKTKQLMENKEDYISRRIQFAEQKKREMISKSREESIRAFLEARERLLKEFLESLKERLRQYVETKEYREQLPKDVKKAVEQFPEKEVIVSVRKADYPLIKGMKTKKTWTYEPMDEQNIGGFILLQKDKVYAFNASYLAEIEDSKYEIGRLLSSELERLEK